VIINVVIGLALYALFFAVCSWVDRRIDTVQIIEIDTLQIDETNTIGE
jgi:multisubunit Na+/H+ antiporter MnhC subunit